MASSRDATPDAGVIDLQAVQRRRKAGLAVALAATTAGLLFTESLWRPGGPTHEAIEFAGLGLVVLCILGRTWSALYIGGRKKTTLVATGPYSVTRNPLYLFSVAGAAGIGLASGSIAVGLLLAVASFVVFDRVIRREEGFLAGRFGAGFTAYRRATPRWWPRLSAWRDADEVPVRPRLVLVTFRDACLFLLALPLLEAIEGLQVDGILPVWLLVP